MVMGMTKEQKMMLADALKHRHDCAFTPGVYEHSIIGQAALLLENSEEVVRCKDCKNCKVTQMNIPGDNPMYVCEHPRGEVGSDPLYMEADDFCSYGERRTDNA